MKLAHNIKVSVFCGPEENEAEIKKALISLFPFGLEKEKINVDEQSATGFNEKKIKIFEIILKKDSHINSFLKNLKEKVGNQAKILAEQAESRIDNELCFFLRLDKEKLVNENAHILTEKGSCFHIKASIAAFPRKREIAIGIVREFFG